MAEVYFIVEERERREKVLDTERTNSKVKHQHLEKEEYSTISIKFVKLKTSMP